MEDFGEAGAANGGRILMVVIRNELIHLVFSV
jgi:hypothetical protein